MNHVVVYRCRQCGGPRKIFKQNWIREFVLACSGQLEPIHLLRPFEDGEFGVCLVHCAEKACKTLSGAPQALRTVTYARHLLEEVAIHPERVKAIVFQPGSDLNMELSGFLEHLKHLDSPGAAPLPSGDHSRPERTTA